MTITVLATAHCDVCGKTALAREEVSPIGAKFWAHPADWYSVDDKGNRWFACSRVCIIEKCKADLNIQ